MKELTRTEALYKITETGLAKFGDFLREIAALIIVFIPLDLWKNEITWRRSFAVILASGVLFLAGMICEWTSLAVDHVRRIWEEENADEPDAGS